jgi:hypothetical protein
MTKELPTEEKLEAWLSGCDASASIQPAEGGEVELTGGWVMNVRHADGGGVYVEIGAFIQEEDVPEL